MIDIIVILYKTLFKLKYSDSDIENYVQEKKNEDIEKEKKLLLKIMENLYKKNVSDTLSDEKKELLDSLVVKFDFKTEEEEKKNLPHSLGRAVSGPVHAATCRSGLAGCIKGHDRDRSDSAPSSRQHRDTPQPPQHDAAGAVARVHAGRVRRPPRRQRHQRQQQQQQPLQPRCRRASAAAAAAAGA